MEFTTSGESLPQILYDYDSNAVYRNLDKWDVGTPLFITGVGGSGKFTLARRLAEMFDAEVISSDTVIFKMKWTKERFEQRNTSRVNEIPVLFNPLILEYVNEYKKDLPVDKLNGTKDRRPSIEDLDNEHNYAKDFLDWVTKAKKSRSEWETKRVIVEGTYPIHAPEAILGYPVMILLPSKRRACINRIRRKRKNGCRLFTAVKTVTIDYIKFEHWFDKKIENTVGILIGICRCLM